MGKQTENQEKGYVFIQSNVTVKVYPGVFYENATNKDKRLPDQLKVIEKWAAFGVLIRKGSFEYAAEIAEWPTVKALIESKVMSLGSRSDTTNDEAAKASKEIAKEAEDAKKEAEATNLEQIADKE